MLRCYFFNIISFEFRHAEEKEFLGGHVFLVKCFDLFKVIFVGEKIPLCRHPTGKQDPVCIEIGCYRSGRMEIRGMDKRQPVSILEIQHLPRELVGEFVFEMGAIVTNEGGGPFMGDNRATFISTSPDKIHQHGNVSAHVRVLMLDDDVCNRLEFDNLRHFLNKVVKVEHRAGINDDPFSVD